MSQSNSPRSANGLLSQMAEADYALIEPQLERSTMIRGQVFARPDEPVDDLWFPEAGFISQIARTSENRRLEIGLFGREGVGPISSVLGIDRTPYEVIVQIEGTGLKIKAADVRAALEKALRFKCFFRVTSSRLSFKWGITRYRVIAALSASVSPDGFSCATIESGKTISS